MATKKPKKTAVSRPKFMSVVKTFASKEECWRELGIGRNTLFKILAGRSATKEVCAIFAAYSGKYSEDEFFIESHGLTARGLRRIT